VNVTVKSMANQTFGIDLHGPDIVEVDVEQETEIGSLSFVIWKIQFFGVSVLS